MNSKAGCRRATRSEDNFNQIINMCYGYTVSSLLRPLGAYLIERDIFTIFSLPGGGGGGGGIFWKDLLKF